jgi:hypothetical protein
MTPLSKQLRELRKATPIEEMKKKANYLFYGGIITLALTVILVATEILLHPAAILTACGIGALSLIAQHLIWRKITLLSDSTHSLEHQAALLRKTIAGKKNWDNGYNAGFTEGHQQETQTKEVMAAALDLLKTPVKK